MCSLNTVAVAGFDTKSQGCVFNLVYHEIDTLRLGGKTHWTPGLAEGNCEINEFRNPPTERVSSLIDWFGSLFKQCCILDVHFDDGQLYYIIVDSVNLLTQCHACGEHFYYSVAVAFVYSFFVSFFCFLSVTLLLFLWCLPKPHFRYTAAVRYFLSSYIAWIYTSSYPQSAS